jgi:hypothetical protein
MSASCLARRYVNYVSRSSQPRDAPWLENATAPLLDVVIAVPFFLATEPQPRLRLAKL